MATYTVDKISYGGNTYNLEGKYLKNLVDGSATGSLRGVGTVEEDSSYTMGQYAFAEGATTVASGAASHAEGSVAVASGDYSHAQNYKTTAQRKSQTTIGEYNVLDTGGTDTTTRGDYALIVGNGTAENARRDALTLGWDGNIRIALMNSISYPVDFQLYVAIYDHGWTSEVID